jgi:DNA mismatch repair protein MSH4
LVKLNQKITDSHNEVINMSDRSIQELIDDIRTEIYPLFKISESIAMLDMITSFAQLVTTKDYVKPELTDALAIKAGRHPIRDKIQIEQYIPNDVYATQQHRFQIVTGCNMSGKSTYIRSIALMTVMAQIGCFVPAQYASFPICHQLFARVSTDDNVEANVSTFAAEMREIAFILRNIERRSLVIIDELGRGTSTTDGLAIAIAIAEALIESRAYVWFVTHFRDLARILAERAGVVNLHLAVEISVHSPKMKMLYKISDGYEEEKYYGLALARVVDLPEDVITTATKVSKVLHQHEEARKSNAKVLSVARRRKLILGLREQLIQAKNGSMEGDELRQWLKRLQDEFLVRMAAIDAEAATALAKEQEESTESNQEVGFSPSGKLEQQGYQESRNRRTDGCSV